MSNAATARSSFGRAIAAHGTTCLLWTVLGLGSLLMAAPFIWMFTATLSPISQAFTLPPRWLPGSDFTIESYLRTVKDYSQLFRYFWNSVYISTLVTVGYVAVTTMAGYAFARLEFPFKRLLFGMLLVSLMVPIQTMIVPLYIIMRGIGLLGTPGSIIVPGMIGAFAPGLSGVFGVFLMRQFFLTMPKDLIEAGKVDGAGPIRIFWTIATPLAKPQMAALAIIVFTTTWNDYFIPLVFMLTGDNQVLPLAVVGISGGRGGEVPAAVILAAVSISILPILIAFVAMQRLIVESFMRAGVK
jgi:multiple sugar transport system permease protein